MIFLCSVFRDSERYLPRYVNQIAELRASTHIPVHVIAVEGDSEDETYKALLGATGIDTVLHCEHGGPKFPSIIHPLRWRQLSVACNVALCAAYRMSTPDDMTIYVESDLVWDAHTMLRLLVDLQDVAAVAPMSMQGMRFYDTWGHTKDGERFSAHPPYFRGYSPNLPALVQIDTAGSCIAMTHDALAHAEFSSQDCIRGVGRSLAAAGFSLWVDPTVRVEHPLP